MVLYQCISVDAFLQHCYQGLSLFCHIGIGLQMKKKILLFSPSARPIRNYGDSCVERERLYPACEKRKETEKELRVEKTHLSAVLEKLLRNFSRDIVKLLSNLLLLQFKVLKKSI